MSTTETQAVPAGTWAVDPVHSTIGFAVGYMAGTFTGTSGDFAAVVTDGVLTGSAKVASVQVNDRESRGPSPVARVLRRRALPGAGLRV